MSKYFKVGGGNGLAHIKQVQWVGYPEWALSIKTLNQIRFNLGLQADVDESSWVQVRLEGPISVSSKNFVLKSGFEQFINQVGNKLSNELLKAIIQMFMVYDPKHKFL